MGKKFVSEIHKQRSNKIIAWLKDHPFFSINPMCKKVGYSQSSMSRTMNDSETLYEHIPEKHLDDIENILINYGYNKNNTTMMDSHRLPGIHFVYENIDWNTMVTVRDKIEESENVLFQSYESTEQTAPGDKPKGKLVLYALRNDDAIHEVKALEEMIGIKHEQ